MRGVLDLSMEEAGTAVAGILTAVAHNIFKNRPLYAGVQRHIAFGLIGLFLGNQIKNYRINYNRKKWIYLEDYMAKHPEKFPEVPKLLYKDVLHAWRPAR